MSTMTWESALQGVTPRTGGSALPPGQYRMKAVAGEGKLNSNNNLMFALTFEVISGPMQGRKAFHNENLPSGSSDKDKERMGYFLGLLEAFGVSSDMLRQMFQGRPVDEASLSYLANYIVGQGRSVKGTCRPQQSDPTRVNWGGWMADDGVEPAPPKQAAASGQPGFPGGAPGGQPPQFGGGAPQGAPGQFQPPAQQAPGLPLGGFPGSGGAVPNQAPDWSQAPAAAQPQQFQPQQAPAQDQGFPGQQFPGQVNPANFHPQGQPQAAPQQFVDPNAPRNDPWANPGEAGYAQPQGQAPQGQAPQQFQQAPQGGQLPGMPAPQQNQPNPNGLPQGGFPQPGQAPQATF